MASPYESYRPEEAAVPQYEAYGISPAPRDPPSQQHDLERPMVEKGSEAECARAARRARCVPRTLAVRIPWVMRRAFASR